MTSKRTERRPQESVATLHWNPGPTRSPPANALTCRCPVALHADVSAVRSQRASPPCVSISPVTDTLERRDVARARQPTQRSEDRGAGRCWPWQP